ncbi:MAG: lantibiotic dehydratase [Clostridium sp.]|uniref:lantibiotic dehydratase n=1 Tax=Clostridium sp. TaxID=1506 RepID=UPI003EE66E38
MYELMNKFFVRIPTLPVDKFCEMYNTNNIEAILKDEVFLEAVKLGSRSLFESIDLDKENNSDVKIAIYKYLARMSSRTTPYGFFSNINIGEFKRETRTKYDSNNMKKRTRVDGKWFIKLVRKLELEEKKYKEVKIYVNESLVYEGNKIKNSFISAYGEIANGEGNRGTIYINNSNNISYILKKIKSGARYTDIYEDFKSINDNFDEILLERLIENLLEKEFIFTELRGNLNSKNQIVELIKKIKDCKIKEKLIDINKMIEKYDNMSVGSGIDMLDLICDKMSAVIKIEDGVYLQSDLRGGFNIELTEKVKSEIEECANFLSYCSFDEVPGKDINKFKNKFIEKYGEAREINVLELIESVDGIDYKDEKEPFYYPQIEEIKVYIKNLIMENIKKQNNFINLKESSVEEILKRNQTRKKKKSDSIEVFMSLVAKNIDDIEEGKYKFYLGPNIGSSCAGKSLGRFSDMIMEVDEIYEEVKNKLNIKSEVINAELRILNSISRMSNVMQNKAFRDAEISILLDEDNEKEKININDIYVGIEENEFYLKSKEKNKKIEIGINNMANSIGVSKVYKFIRDISIDKNQRNIASLLFHIGLDEFDYLPEIRYGKVILYPRTWSIDVSNFDRIKNKSEFIKEILEKYKKNYQLPQFVYLTENDNKLIIDLKNNEHIEIIKRFMIKTSSQRIYLQEKEFSEDEIWIETRTGKYIGEFVFQLMDNENMSEEKSKEKSKEKIEKLEIKSDVDLLKGEISSNDKRRKFNLFSEWIYFKIYYDNNRTMEMIGKYIFELNEILNKNKLANDIFFIRYKDEKNHIRLRIKCLDESKVYCIYKEVERWINKLESEKVIYNIEMHPYIRELERYGGPIVMEKVEKLFCEQSRILEMYMNLKSRKMIDFKDEDFALLSGVNLFENLGLNFENQYILLNSMFNKNLYRDEFKKNRDKYMEICDYTKNKMKLDKDVKNLVDRQSEIICKIKSVIEEEDSKGRLYSTKEKIYISLIHMTYNRIIGIDAEKEQKIMAIHRHTMYALKTYYYYSRIKE